MLAQFLRSPVGLCFTVFLLAMCASLPLAFGLDMDSFADRATLIAITVALFVAVPLLIISRIFREDVREYGLRFPEKAFEAGALTFLVLIPHLIFVFIFSNHAAFDARYSFTGESYLLSVVLLPVLYFFAEEFLFRGFLVSALWKSARYWGVVLGAGLFALLHISKPAPEIAFSFVSALMLSWLALKTKSFVPAAVIHSAIALLLTSLVTFS